MTSLYNPHNSPEHRKAQLKIKKILLSHYWNVIIEAFTPTPNEKYYIFSSATEEFTTKPYQLDVFAINPKEDCADLVAYPVIGIELDGKTGHKTSKYQTIRDEIRTDSIKAMYPDLKIFRFDVKDLIGRGYVNPKTKKRHSLLTDEEILAEVRIKCTHA